MNAKVNGKMTKYVLLHSAMWSVLAFLSLTAVGMIVGFVTDGGIGSGAAQINDCLFMFIAMHNIDMHGKISVKFMPFMYSRKKLFRLRMLCSISSVAVYAFCRTWIQWFYHDQIVASYLEDEANAVFTRISLPEMYVCNCIIMFAMCMLVLWRDSMGWDFGFGYIGQSKSEWSVQMQYRASVRRERMTRLKKAGRNLYGIFEFTLIVTIMVLTAMYYYFQLQHGVWLRIGVAAAVAVIGVVFCLLARRRFQPAYM